MRGIVGRRFLAVKGFCLFQKRNPLFRAAVKPFLYRFGRPDVLHAPFTSEVRREVATATPRVVYCHDRIGHGKPLLRRANKRTRPCSPPARPRGHRGAAVIVRAKNRVGKGRGSRRL
jgi:hypothetical protein